MKTMNDPGRRTLLTSFRDAARGVWDGIKSERNMRIHAVVAVYVLGFSFGLSLSRAEWAVLILAIGAVTGAELLNTSVEKLCDFNEKRINPHIRSVKDMAAGAVLLCAACAALVGVAVLWRSELWQLLLGIVKSPVKLLLLLLSAVIAVVFIILGPSGIWEKLRVRKKS